MKAQNDQKGQGGPQGPEDPSGNGQGAGKNPSQTAESSSQPDSQNSEPADSGGPGSGNGPGSGSVTDRERFATEVMDDLRQESNEAREILPSSSELENLQKTLQTGGTAHALGPGQVVATFQMIQAPLSRVVSLLQAELKRAQRQHQLTDQNPEKAPPAYRDAVADYFERLSKDYKTTPEGADRAQSGGKTQ
jgi:hypothetical protein